MSINEIKRVARMNGKIGFVQDRAITRDWVEQDDINNQAAYLATYAAGIEGWNDVQRGVFADVYAGTYQACQRRFYRIR